MDIRVATPELLLSSLSEFLAAQMGLHFPRERWGDLERGIAAAASEFGMADVQSCINWLVSTSLTRNQVEILASHLTVGETYFFREQRSFEMLEEHVLPEILRVRGETGSRVRIWSAGCCTGEEPYSIAMLLDQLIPDAVKRNFTILATDINPRFVRKAAEGVYSEWSFRETPPWIRERYFNRRKDGRFEIKPHIRKMVTFSYFNLAGDVYPSLWSNTNAMDVIFCRNVLMYFGAEQAREVVAKLRSSLVDGGWLITSPAETSGILFSAFTAVEFPGVFFYRRMASGAPRTVVAGHRLPAFDVAPKSLHPEELIAPPELPGLDVMRSAPPLEAPREPAQVQEMEPGAIHEQKPDESEAPRHRARTCANQGKLAEAIEWCERAIASDKLDPASHYLLATIQQEQGYTDSAAQALKRALYLDPQFVLAHFALGNLCLSQGRHRNAERHFGNALALLQVRPHGEILPESEGLTAGRLIEIVMSVQSSLLRGRKESA
ncbi:MAG: tetratricopeptide repeat protein [Betaproteobacteria bacterium]|nr:tetratricopeptide repeat protein [Betaproteobacteria bacterium]